MTKTRKSSHSSFKRRDEAINPAWPPASVASSPGFNWNHYDFIDMRHSCDVIMLLRRGNAIKTESI